MEADLPMPQLQYLLVLDFEATCVQDKKIEPCPQIIEFPVVVVDLKNGKRLDVFHHYVRPTVNPELSSFCTQLTGITQNMVDKGLTIQQVLQLFSAWLSSLTYLKEGNYTIITCGDWDLRTCLRIEAKHKRLYVPNSLRNYINIKKYFAKIIGPQGSGGMMPMLKALGIPHEGRHHSGIDDVLNICSICLELYQKHGAIYPKTEINSVVFHLPPQNIKPEIRYLLVLDFEATCLKNEKIQPCPEIIEFPVMLLDTHNVKVLGEFHQYVRPTLNPKLSAFCTQLTGITQQQVDGKASIQEVLADFDKWIQGYPQLQKGELAFLTCGDWDICTCLRLQTKTKGIKIQRYFERYVNLKSYFPKLVKTKGKINGMMDMLRCLNLKPEGKHHSGIDDVRNIARVCLELLTNFDAKFPKSELRNIQL